MAMVTRLGQALVFTRVAVPTAVKVNTRLGKATPKCFTKVLADTAVQRKLSHNKEKTLRHTESVTIISKTPQKSLSEYSTTTVVVMSLDGIKAVRPRPGSG